MCSQRFKFENKRTFHQESFEKMRIRSQRKFHVFLMDVLKRNRSCVNLNDRILNLHVLQLLSFSVTLENTPTYLYVYFLIIKEYLIITITML